MFNDLPTELLDEPTGSPPITAEQAQQRHDAALNILKSVAGLFGILAEMDVDATPVEGDQILSTTALAQLFEGAAQAVTITGVQLDVADKDATLADIIAGLDKWEHRARQLALNAMRDATPADVLARMKDVAGADLFTARRAEIPGPGGLPFDA